MTEQRLRFSRETWRKMEHVRDGLEDTRYSIAKRYHSNYSARVGMVSRTIWVVSFEGDVLGSGRLYRDAVSLANKHYQQRSDDNE